MEATSGRRSLAAAIISFALWSSRAGITEMSMRTSGCLRAHSEKISRNRVATSWRAARCEYSCCAHIVRVSGASSRPTLTGVTRSSSAGATTGVAPVRNAPSRMTMVARAEFSISVGPFSARPDWSPRSVRRMRPGRGPGGSRPSTRIVQTAPCLRRSERSPRVRHSRRVQRAPLDR